MKAKNLAITILLITSAFADDTYTGILNDTNYQKLMSSIALDEFNSAMIKNPSIAYDSQHQATIFGTANPVSPLMEFRYSDGYQLNNINLVQNNPIQQGTPTLDSSDDGGMWTGISELSNPYDQRPNGINITQNMATQEHLVNYSQTASTSTTNGWFFSAGVAYEYKWTGILDSDFDVVDSEYVQSVKVNVTAGANGSTTNSTSITTGYSEIAPSFTIPVPAGCKAIVTQKLGSATFSGDYTYTAVVDKVQLKFNTVTGTYNNYYTNSGYVDLIDLVKLGSIPQTALTIDANNNLLLNGKGKYTATGAYENENGENLYSVTIAYEEATLGTHYCTPPVSATVENTLISGRNIDGNIFDIKNSDHGFSFKLLPKACSKKELYTNLENK